jgi:GTP-dependent phosphoenolpyruvate carboxykinase
MTPKEILMATPTVSGQTVPTTHPAIIDWVDEVAALTTPDKVVWCDGGDDEWRRLTTLLVDKGTFVRLPPKQNSFWCASDPEDVARVEDRTFICSQDRSDASQKRAVSRYVAMLRQPLLTWANRLAMSRRDGDVSREL